jgi:hypothetical protein
MLSFKVEPSASARGVPSLKTLSSHIKYQQTPGGEDSWVFRYEYLRYPKNKYSPGHMHVRGTPAQADCLGRKEKLEDVHFPTGRVTTESIIRLLIDDFDIDANEPPEVWRPLLQETKRHSFEWHGSPSRGASNNCKG